jgi:hypothetical protein
MMAEFRDMSRRWLAVAFAAAGFAVLTATAGCGSLKQIGAGAHNAPAKTFTITSRVTTVVINGGAASITVTGSARSTVLVSEQSSYSKTPPVTSRRVAGTTLTLSYSCGSQLVCGVAYELKVPRGVAVQASTRTGAITLTSIAGPVSAQTTAGLITAGDLTSPTAVLRSSAGGIDATFSAAPASVRASTNVGPITLAVPTSAAYNVSTHTYVGASTVTVRKSTSSPHVITASSDLGSITISPS